MTEPDPEKSLEMAKFLQACQDLLRKHNLVSVFGLCRYPGDDFPGRTENIAWKGQYQSSTYRCESSFLARLTS